jgi:Ca2+-transporting ATPase
MERKPRDPKSGLLNARILIKSIVQGLIIFAASFGTYYTVLAGDPVNAPVARSMGLAIIMLSNLFLVQVNSSDHDLVIKSIKHLSKVGLGYVGCQYWNPGASRSYSIYTCLSLC